jgi:hypothetical protein
VVSTSLCLPGTLLAVALSAAAGGAAPAAARPEPPSAPAGDAAPASLPIARAAGPISIDGDLADSGWRGAAPITTWFETNPGDNTPPRVQSVGYLAYDDRFLYVGLRFEDPEPARIRAPLGDRDNLSSATDYGGIILDTRNDGRTGTLFLANARGLQYDAVTDDGGAGEDSAPDFYWEAAGAITKTGWTLEIRIPFSSLRYGEADPQTWGVMLYRNYPRDFRYQFMTARMPRGSSCFICNENKLPGLARLPRAGHLVAVPHLSAREEALPEAGPGTPLRSGSVHGDAGLDVKWTPTAGTAIDATLNPDFSQVESDVAQISANERFALFYPEKRPFFLEGINLFSTPIQAVYTRTITSPRFGLRGTGRWGALAFTGLVTDDRGGGQVILPGSNGSSFADQDFHSLVAVGRMRRDFGASFVSLLLSDREQQGGSFNRVAGPDFQWRPNKSDVVSGQMLWSETRTPSRPDLSDEWDGRHLADHAADASWLRSTRSYDFSAEYKDIGAGFRADNGFVPQAGFREAYFEPGYTWRPATGLVRRLRTYLITDYAQDRQGRLLSQTLSPGFGLDARWYTFVRIRYAWERLRAGDGDQTLPRGRLVFTVTSSPSRLLSGLNLDGWVGSDIDFAGGRRGAGGKVTLTVPLRLSDHLELRLDEEARWLNVDAGGARSRLFTARVDRLRATYTLTSRTFVRLIGQYVSTRRDPTLYTSAVDRRDGSFAGSALLAYKLNWQTVLYAGYGEDRELDGNEKLVPSQRQLFVKVSYAFQR